MNEFQGFSEATATNQDPSMNPDVLANSVSTKWNYEKTVTQIELIIAQIEAGELELAEVFEQFGVAVEYLHQCETFLHQRQQQMDLLIENLVDDSESEL